MNARKPEIEPRSYTVPIRTRQNQAKVLRACKDLRYFITIDFPFKGAPRNCAELNKAIREVLNALAQIGIHGVAFIEFNDPKQIYGRNIPHLHIATPADFTFDGDWVDPSWALYNQLLKALGDSLPWFSSTYLLTPNILDVEKITNLHRLAGYLAKLDFELEGEMRFSSKGRKQKKIPVKYFPLRRLMRFYGDYVNPLKNQTVKRSIVNVRDALEDLED